MFWKNQYRDPDALQKVRDTAGNAISYAFDTVASKDTQFAVVNSLAEDKPGKVVSVLPPVEGVQDIRKDVQVNCSSSSNYNSNC